LDEKMSRQNRRHRPASADQCSMKVGMAIRRKSLQALQQHREGHETSPDHERTWPSEAEHQREREIADEVVDPPTESRARYPLGGAKGGKYEQDQDGHAAKF
jgi:hypothetical protein